VGGQEDPQAQGERGGTQSFQGVTLEHGERQKMISSKKGGKRKERKSSLLSLSLLLGEERQTGLCGLVKKGGRGPSSTVSRKSTLSREVRYKDLYYEKKREHTYFWGRGHSYFRGGGKKKSEHMH